LVQPACRLLAGFRHADAMAGQFQVAQVSNEEGWVLSQDAFDAMLAGLILIEKLQAESTKLFASVDQDLRLPRLR
jgi:hypothetical protein